MTNYMLMNVSSALKLALLAQILFASAAVVLAASGLARLLILKDRSSRVAQAGNSGWLILSGGSLAMVSLIHFAKDVLEIAGSGTLGSGDGWTLVIDVVPIAILFFVSGMAAGRRANAG